jgi:ABC-type transporter MlaC component
MASVPFSRRSIAVKQLSFFRRIALAAGFGAIILAGSAPALAADCPAAGPVKAAAASFKSAARSGSAGAFSSALARHTNVASLAMFALGPYRKDLPPGRRAEYVRSAHAFMGAFLAEYGSKFSGANLTIENCQGGLVETTASGRDIVWKVAGSRIQDVRVGGVWLAPQLKSKFVKVIRQGDGDVTALLDYLSDRRSARN